MTTEEISSAEVWKMVREFAQTLTGEQTKYFLEENSRELNKRSVGAKELLALMPASFKPHKLKVEKAMEKAESEIEKADLVYRAFAEWAEHGDQPMVDIVDALKGKEFQILDFMDTKFQEKRGLKRVAEGPANGDEGTCNKNPRVIEVAKRGDDTRAKMPNCFLLPSSDAGLVVDQYRSVWSYDTRQKLTYYIHRDTFPKEHVDKFAADFQTAATNWMDTCGVSFQSVDSKEEYLFQVKHMPQGTGKDKESNALAIAFIPSLSKDDRTIEVYPSLWNPANSMSIVGVLRHELGHVLGFYHEFAPRLEVEVLRKSGVQPTTIGKRNSQSVMTYPWKEKNDPNPNWSMEITDQDAKEAKMLYGPPLSRVKFIDH